MPRFDDGQPGRRFGIEEIEPPHDSAKKREDSDEGGVHGWKFYTGMGARG